MSSNNLICTPTKSGLKNGWLSLLLQVNCKMTFVGRTLLSRADRTDGPAQNYTLTSIDFRQSISSWTKGSNISKACSSEEFTLDLFRLMCSSCHRKIRTFISKSGWKSKESSKVPPLFQVIGEFMLYPTQTFQQAEHFLWLFKKHYWSNNTQNEVKANGCAIKTLYPEYFPLHTLNKILNAKFCIWGDPYPKSWINEDICVSPAADTCFLPSSCWSGLEQQAALWLQPRIWRRGNFLPEKQCIYGKGKYSDINPPHNSLAIGNKMSWTLLCCVLPTQQAKASHRWTTTK